MNTNIDLIIVTIIPFVILIVKSFFTHGQRSYNLLSDPSEEFNASILIISVLYLGMFCELALIAKHLESMLSYLLKSLQSVVFNLSPPIQPRYNLYETLLILLYITLFVIIVLIFKKYMDNYHSNISSDINAYILACKENPNKKIHSVLLWILYIAFMVAMYFCLKILEIELKTLVILISLCSNTLFLAIIGYRVRIEYFSKLKITRTVLTDNCEIYLPIVTEHSGCYTKEIVKTDMIDNNSIGSLTESILMSKKPFIDGYLIHSDQEKHIVITDSFEIAINRHWILYQYELK